MANVEIRSSAISGITKQAISMIGTTTLRIHMLAISGMSTACNPSSWSRVIRRTWYGVGTRWHGASWLAAASNTRAIALFSAVDARTAPMPPTVPNSASMAMLKRKMKSMLPTTSVVVVRSTPTLRSRSRR